MKPTEKLTPGHGFDAKLKAARHHTGLTQKEISERLGIPLRTIESWEGGVRVPAPWVARLLLAKLADMANQAKP